MPRCNETASLALCRLRGRGPLMGESKAGQRVWAEKAIVIMLWRRAGAHSAACSWGAVTNSSAVWD